MIRFLDTDVFAVQKGEVSRSYIRSYFLRKGHMDDILVVYDEEMYYGIITYDSFLNTAGSEDKENFIFRERIIVTPDNDAMWEDFREIFQRADIKNALVPMFNAQGEILYFAYDDKWKGNKIRQNIIESVLGELENMEQNCLRLEGSNFRLGGIAPITRAVPSF